METRVPSCDLKPQTTAPLFHTYLKLGALARLRYSKISARSKIISAQTLLALCQPNSGSDSASSQPDSVDLAMNGIPCFNLRVGKYTRCLQRKKLIAVTPFFSETQS